MKFLPVTVSILLFVVTISEMGQADESTQPSLNAMLIHSDEFTELNQKIQANVNPRMRLRLQSEIWVDRAQQRRLFYDENYLRGLTPFCDLMGLGCFDINYTDNPSAITVFSPELMSAYDGLNLTGEVFLLGIASQADASGGFGLSRNHPAVGSIAAGGYLDFQTRKRIDQNELQSNWQKLVVLATTQTPGSIKEFELFFAHHPRFLSELPRILRQSLESDQKQGIISPMTDALEKTTGHLLLLTADVFSRSVDSRGPTYPFMYDDLTPRGSLLRIEDVGLQLIAAKRLPQIKHMSSTVRDRFSKFETHCGEQDGDSIADGIYDPTENVVYLDLTAPFFENVFTLFHEFDHVRAFHSTLVADFAKSVVGILKLPDSQETKELLQQTILRQFATLELLAIDSTARLYRGVGHLAYQWGGVGPRSAKAWHDSYFGANNALDLYIPRSHREFKVLEPAYTLNRKNPLAVLRTLATGGLDEVVIVSRKDKKDQEDARNYYGRVTRTERSLPGFLASRQISHLENYRKKYLCEAPPLDVREFGTIHRQVNQRLTFPDRQVLTCKDLERLVTALGSYNRYGLPFPYEVDGGWESCKLASGGLNLKGGPLSVRAGLPNLRGPIPSSALKPVKGRKK